MTWMKQELKSFGSRCILRAAPTLIVAGRYDETLSLAAEVEPLYQLLGAPKRLEVIDGGHIPPVALWLPLARTWLEKAIGR